jgi:acyl-CoA synthetase (AMP-forming)/AMP-acid ligase II
MNSLSELNFAGLLRAAAHEHQSRAAIKCGDSETSFEALSSRSAAVSAALARAQIQPGDRCAILIKDAADAAAAFFGVLAAGAVAINVNELYRPRQIEYVLRHSEASVLLTSRELLEALPRKLNVDAYILCIEDLPRRAPQVPLAAVAADAPAQITYTSGSTGHPKGVITSHAALWAGVRIVAEYLELRADDRIAGLLPFSFVYGFNQLSTALYRGATLVTERSTLAAEIVAMLRRERVTVLACVPPLWHQLLNVGTFRNEPLEHFRIMTCAGGRLPPNAVRELRQAQPQALLYLMYGLTEVFRSTYLPPDLVDAHPDSMGQAVPESTVYVVRDDGTLADPGEVGELVHGGPTVGLGYHNNADATALVFRANPFLKAGEQGPARVAFSGDLVRQDERGLLFYVGRRDRMIKTLGFRVSPDEVLDVLQASREVADAAIVTEPDQIRGERIVACVVLKNPAALERVVSFCRLELPRHMQPARYVVLPSIPRNANGKHDIPALILQAAQDTAIAS